MLEKEIEQWLVQEVRHRGGLCLKFLSPGNTGVPDRIVLAPGGRVVFLELKTETGRLTKLQEWTHKEMRKRHADVRVIRGMQEARSFVEEVMPDGIQAP